MTNLNYKNQEQGLILIELLTAMAVFAIGVITIFALFVNATKGTLISLDRTRENLLSNEALEAAYSISKSDQDYLTPGKYEVGLNDNNQWVLIPKTGLMSHFLLANNAQDSTIYKDKNNGIMQGVTFMEDRKGQPLATARFNGADSYIKTEYAFSLQIEGPLTLSAWVLDTGVEEIPTPRTIAGKYDIEEEEGKRGGYMLYKEGDYYYFVISGKEASGEEKTDFIPAPSDKISWWEHVTGIYDPGVNDAGKGTLRLYVNGEEKASGETNITAINKAPGIEFYIGNDASGSNPWQGRISGVRVYNRALTTSEISGLYGSYSVPYEKSLIVSDINELSGIWSFNEGEGCITHDNSENNNHGIIKNCTTTQWVTNKQEKSGRAFNFKNDNYIEIADSSTLQIENEISISLWIKIPEELPETDMTILHKRAAGAKDYSFSLTYQGAEEEKGYGWAVSAGKSDPLTQVKLPGSAIADRWQHLIVAFDSTSTNRKMYIDNREIDDDFLKTDFDNPGSNSNLFIGRNAAGENNLSGVVIDDLRIYNKILTPVERQAIFLNKINYYLE